MKNFWDKLDILVGTKEIVIDRAKGSTHPRYSDYIYPYDYGYLKDTISSDGAGIDIWIGTGDTSMVTGLITTFDPLKNDMESKLLLGCSESEMVEILSVIKEEKWWQSLLSAIKK